MKTTEKVPDNLNKRYQKKKMTHTHTPFQSIQLAGKGRRKEKKKRKIGIQFDGGTRMLLEEIRAGDNVT